MEKLKNELKHFVNEQMHNVVLSNPRDKEKSLKTKITPVLMGNQVVYQSETLVGKQMFHKNMNKDECISSILELLEEQYRQAVLVSPLGQMNVLVGKRGTVTVKSKKNPAAKILPQQDVKERLRSHNRKKQYILEEGNPIPFLVELGVMSKNGKVIHQKYDKFRQINRFLEFIEDILPKLKKDSENTIIDFGCGKSYLTFAMYYYLHVMKGYSIRVIGLDLKHDVISHCNALSEKFGFEKLKFYHGDIANYEGVNQVDMVVTLHACDVATDYALDKAIKWGAEVILSVPCCQHEWNKSIQNELLQPVLKYGIIKERMSALYTDAIRAEILENKGYRTQILEFIDMEHTPKNILIRAVKQGRPKDNKAEIDQILEFFHVKPALYRLVMEE